LKIGTFEIGTFDIILAVIFIVLLVTPIPFDEVIPVVLLFIRLFAGKEKSDRAKEVLEPLS